MKNIAMFSEENRRIRFKIYIEMGGFPFFLLYIWVGSLLCLSYLARARIDESVETLDTWCALKKECDMIAKLQMDHKSNDI